jgi:pimeloyl-ACP methyl ester carboxylesterase
MPVAKWFRGKARWVLLITIGILATLPLCGALYQTLCVRAEAVRFPPPGQLIDIGGRRLHLICLGHGDPTVIFEPGALQTSISSELARTEVSSQTRVCSYDRMGSGWSDPGPDGPISAGQLTDDLRLLLERAGIAPPYIIVPSSFGGLTAEMFARRYPERVAGLVFLDAANSEVLERGLVLIESKQFEKICLARLPARLGVLRLMDPLGLRSLSPQSDRGIALLYRAEPMDTLCAIARGLPASAQEMRSAPPLSPRIPLVVLTHDMTTGFIPPGMQFLTRDPQYKSLMSEWRPLQQQFSKCSPSGVWRAVPGSTHLIASSQPYAVAVTILQMVEQVRQEPRKERPF